MTDVLVDGTTWSSGFLSSLLTAGQGNGSGYAIPVGTSAQLQDLPWVNLNQIQIVFSENVNVQASDLVLSGVNTPQYAVSGFVYNPATLTATWTLTAPLPADRLVLSLDGHSPNGITDQAGNLLEGQWTNGASVYPSGDGTAGGDFTFAFNVVPADVNQDGVVNGLDIAQAASNWLQTGAAKGDANGDNVVNGLDIAAIASNWLTALPSAGGATAAEIPALNPASAAGLGPPLPPPLTLASSDVARADNDNAAGLNDLSAVTIAGMAAGALNDSASLSGGTWTALTNFAPSGLGTMMLLSDGTVMAQGSGTNKNWFRLTPDATGSYTNGTWSQLASMGTQRLYFGSNVLPSGKVFLVGGEYSGPSGTQNWTSTGEIYDPVANSWSAITSFPRSQFGDDPTELLPNGNVLAGYLSGPQTYIYNPATNSWTQTGTKLLNDRSDEESWVTLPDGSILSYDIFASPASGAGHAQRYVPATNTWVDAGSVPVPLSGSSFGEELGPAFLLPDGRVFQLGARWQYGFVHAVDQLVGGWADDSEWQGA